VSVGIRLKEERKRLGLTQEAMGVACGVAKRTQILFEQDVTCPVGPTSSPPMNSASM
jgi:DNA-binding XRE family transcriptional regulator